MSIYQQIQRQVDAHDVMLYIKGTPEAPEESFSGQVVAIFKELQVDFGTANVLESPELRQAIKDFSNWPTLPQIYIHGKFVGGSDAIVDMHKAGELRRLLASKP
ncbi:glutaredoxin [Achlya hypogyna]|uniref:Glutaredoxin n=1 Tax=Achlya hypogyna TaxID=1202772 RepID=A0A1V9ZU86_ACHHY|nr:glutaredoxin [Achlya hypogyna]